MDSQVLTNPQHSQGGKSHGAQVCTKCGWNYPKPHPSAKNRRAHKNVCGTIKGFEILDSEKANQTLDLQKEHCFDDELKTPSPRVMEKADERIGGIGEISEEDVFADAVCEFSCSLVSDSFKEKGEMATNCAGKSSKNPADEYGTFQGETQQCNSSSTGYVVKTSEVVQESCEVPPVENYNVPITVEAASGNQQGGEPSTEGHSMASKTLSESSEGAQVIDGADTISNVGLESECKELAPAIGKIVDTSNSSWNDEVIYSDLEGPHGFTTSMIYPGEADYVFSETENVPVDTSPLKANAAQVTSTSQSVPDYKPFAKNADVSLHGTKGLEEFESNHSTSPCLPEPPKELECETDTLTQKENFGIQPKSLTNGTEVSSSDKLLLEDKSEPQGQTALGAVKEFPSTQNIVISKTDPEDIETKAKEDLSSFGAAQEEETVESEILRMSLPAIDPIVADSNADVGHAANKTGVVDLTGHESELIQANVVAEENSQSNKLSSESSCAVEYVSPVAVVLEGEDANNRTKSSAETCNDSILLSGAEACESNDEVCGESNKGGLVEESKFINVTNTTEDPMSHSRLTGTAPDDSAKTANHTLTESGKTEFHKVVGGLGVIQANEIDGNMKAHNFYAEVPVTIESNDHRDFGRLQNLSEAQIRSLVSSPLVSRNNTTTAFEYNLGSASGPSGGVNKPENVSESSSLAVALSKNQEMTRSWSTGNEQHIPLKNLLSEAKSPRLLAEAKKDNESNISRVSSILGQETSPEDGRWPERREVSEEWNSPAKYPVDLKREDRKVKGRPFWVPFVCCSSVK